MLADDESVQEEKIGGCMARHPNNSGLYCIRHFPCKSDDHLGVIRHIDGTQEMVRFGKDAEALLAQFGSKLIKRVIPITEEVDDN